MHGGAGNNQISDTGESAEGFKFGSHGGTQSCNLGNTSRDKRCLGIVPVAQAVRHTGCQSHYIFQGSAELHAQHVGAGIHAEHITDEDIL